MVSQKNKALDICRLLQVSQNQLIAVVGDITSFTPNIIITISCVSVQIRKALNFIIDSRFFIYGIKVTKIGVLDFR